MDITAYARMFLASVFTGVSGVLDRVQVAGERVSEQTAVIMQFCVFGFLGLVTASASASAARGSGDIDVGWWWCQATTAVFCTGLLAQQKFMAKHPAGLVMGLTAGYPLITQFTAWALMGSKFHATTLGACALIVFGSMLLVRSRDAEVEHVIDKGTIVTALVATVGFGLSTVCEAEALRASMNNPLVVTTNLLQIRGAWALALVIAATRGITVKKIVEKLDENGNPVDVIMYETRRSGPFFQFRNSRAWLAGGLSSLFSTVGTFCYIGALTVFPLVEVTVVVSTYPAVTHLLSVLFLKERASLSRAAGIVLVICGAMVVSLDPSAAKWLLFSTAVVLALWAAIWAIKKHGCRHANFMDRKKIFGPECSSHPVEVPSDADPNTHAD